MWLTEKFDQARQYIADCKEYRRLIDREKLMFNPGKLVLMQEFDFYSGFARSNGDDPRTYLQEWQKRSITDFVKTAVLNGMQTFLIPLPLIEPKAREIVEENARKFLEVKDVMVAKMRDALEEERRKAEGGTGNVSIAFMEMAIRLLDDTELPSHTNAHRLGDLMTCWDQALPGGWKRTESFSIFLGEGQKMLDFYKAVNGMKDYSYLFPNHPKPPRNSEKQDNPAKEADREWQPAFHGA
jgi:hypothetical protein